LYNHSQKKSNAPAAVAKNAVPGMQNGRKSDKTAKNSLTKPDKTSFRVENGGDLW